MYYLLFTIGRCKLFKLWIPVSSFQTYVWSLLEFIITLCCTFNFPSRLQKDILFMCSVVPFPSYVIFTWYGLLDMQFLSFQFCIHLFPSSLLSVPIFYIPNLFIEVHLTLSEQKYIYIYILVVLILKNKETSCVSCSGFITHDFNWGKIFVLAIHSIAIFVCGRQTYTRFVFTVHGVTVCIS